MVFEKKNRWVRARNFGNNVRGSAKPKTQHVYLLKYQHLNIALICQHFFVWSNMWGKSVSIMKSTFIFLLVAQASAKREEKKIQKQTCKTGLELYKCWYLCYEIKI